jgi:flavin-dependent dehydrogenase
LQCGRTFLSNGESNFIILEKNPSVIKNNSWKTFQPVIEEFNLKEHVFRDINTIHFRVVDNNKSQLISEIKQDIPCYVLNSESIYKDYLRELQIHIKTNAKVESIIKKDDFFIISGQDFKYEAKILIDASGSHSIVDKLLGYNDFEQNTMYCCYAIRYDNCNTNLIRNSAFFDFDHQFELMGAWVYPINETQAEIGIARYTSKKEFDEPNYLEKFNSLIEQYKKLPPYKDIFQNGIYVKTMKGYAPLKPREFIQRNNIYYIGDTKGAIPWSGYGVENALKSGKEAALSIMNNKKYKY